MKTKVTVERCDNPECDYEEIIGADNEPATGYHFQKGFYILAGGGPIPAFYAHQKACVLRAMQAVMDADR